MEDAGLGIIAVLFMRLQQAEKGGVRRLRPMAIAFPDQDSLRFRIAILDRFLKTAEEGRALFVITVFSVTPQGEFDERKMKILFLDDIKLGLGENLIAHLLTPLSWVVSL